MEDNIRLLERLYDEVGPSLLGYFRRQPALASAADDLLQDTFVRALKRIDRMQAAVSQRAYLFGIARHVGIDALRRMRPWADLSSDAAAASRPEDDRLESMRQAIAELPEGQREALLLKLDHDMSYAEIAAVLGIPVGTVRSRLHHAVLRLRQTLNPL